MRLYKLKSYITKVLNVLQCFQIFSSCLQKNVQKFVIRCKCFFCIQAKKSSFLHQNSRADATFITEEAFIEKNRVIPEFCVANSSLENGCKNILYEFSEPHGTSASDETKI